MLVSLLKLMRSQWGRKGSGSKQVGDALILLDCFQRFLDDYVRDEPTVTLLILTEYRCLGSNPTI